MASRNKQFSSRTPFSHQGSHNLTLQHAHGPFQFLNPTQGLFRHSLPTSTPSSHLTTDSAEAGGGSPNNNAGQVGSTAAASATAIKHWPSVEGVNFLWRSRDNRKGRHPLRVQKPLPDSSNNALLGAPRPSSHPREVLKGIVKTFTCFPVWDISWLVAFIFTAGSVVWVCNVCLYS